MNPHLLKLTFIPGLKDIVLAEITTHPELSIIRAGTSDVYLSATDATNVILGMRSIVNAYTVVRDPKYNPRFLSTHKSVIGDSIASIINSQKNLFKTFKLSCAGSDSKEVRDIEHYIRDTFKLTIAEDADLELYIGRIDETWEVGVRLTPRPVSLREYKVAHIKGGLNPTIAYAMNTFCALDSIHSYLNIFSGSATLLTEAALSNPELMLKGFDIDGKTNALAVENIKKAGKLKQIQLKTADIFTSPDLGMFDCIVSDLPFGMQIGKGEDLAALYTGFITYSETHLNPGGTLVAYTTEHELLEGILEESNFTITQKLELKVSTSISVHTYIHPKIFVCKLK